jgi:hypothetical protein
MDTFQQSWNYQGVPKVMMSLFSDFKAEVLLSAINFNS